MMYLGIANSKSSPAAINGVSGCRRVVIFGVGKLGISPIDTNSTPIVAVVALDRIGLGIV